MTVILLVVLIGVMIYYFINRRKLEAIIKHLQKENLDNQNDYKQKEANFNNEIMLLVSQKNALSKYQTIVDADNKAKEILSEAENSASLILLNAKKELEIANFEAKDMKQKASFEAQIIKDNSNYIIEVANAEAKDIKQKASSEAQTIKDRSKSILDNANIDYRKIIDTANKRAEEIAGDAYRALQNVDNLEKTAQAIKNIIHGYGNEYLIPTFSLLDDLAEEFGYTKAGEELKSARERARLMIKYETAAKCDYVEINRKVTAINFVLDAFNGKVDSILSTVKKDNFGTLQQKITDAYNLVNNNGRAFRNAVITEEYCAVRQEELKWAVIINELKWQEREEQRVIKEQIREEEKARREFERAIKETEKEEELIRKAIEKIKKEVEQASAAQKEKYEAKLIELNEKLKVAEEKNQRAISMAQQTRSGNVYIISNIGSFGENVYKIGMTRRLEPLDRVKELGDASVPFEFDVHSMIYSNDAPTLERDLHKKFLLMQVNKVNPRKEFFRVPLKDIKSEIDKMGFEVKWTMAAEAKQYRESLTIDKAIQNGNFNREEWLKYQTKLADELPVEEEQEA